MVSQQARSMARFHLDLALALYEARGKVGLSVNELAARSGLDPERVEMIEEGDTTSVREIAQLYDALGIGREKLIPCDPVTKPSTIESFEVISLQEDLSPQAYLVRSAVSLLSPQRRPDWNWRSRGSGFAAAANARGTKTRSLASRV